MPLSLTSIDASTPPLVNLPSMSLDDGAEQFDGHKFNEDEDEEEESDDEAGLYHLPDVTLQRPDESLVMLSMEPRSKWQTLFDQDLIRARNKPKEAPKAPELAPFYLPTVAGVNPTFAAPIETEEKVVADTEKKDSPLSSSQNELGALLWQCSDRHNCMTFLSSSFKICKRSRFTDLMHVKKTLR